MVRLNRLAALLSDCVVSVSADAAHVARELERVPAHKLRLLRNGIDVSAFSVGSSKAKTGQRVIHVARLNIIKDQPTLLRAARLVADALPGFRLDIVGDGPERAALLALRNELQLQEHVAFLGERADVPELLAAADVFVLPSVGEGLSMTLLEAMASSLPVVCTDVGGNPEVVAAGETGLLVPPQQPAALAAALLALLRDPARARRLGAAGRHRVEVEFDVRRVVASYEALYRALLARRHDLPAGWPGLASQRREHKSVRLAGIAASRGAASRQEGNLAVQRTEHPGARWSNRLYNRGGCSQ
jgi:glycosyltransferase involved in cell wall biosynthesis